MVNGDEFGAVGESRLDLHVVNHFRHAFHHVVAFEQRGAVAHQVCDAAAVARALDDFIGDDRDRLRVIEFQARVFGGGGPNPLP